MPNFLAIFSATLLLASFSITESVPARTWHVPSEVSTIDAAIDSCYHRPGDNIIVAGGVYYEHNIRFGQTPINLQSETGEPDCVTIDAQGQGPVLEFMDTPSLTYVKGFTFTGGHHHLGGAANLGISNPTFENCIFIDNTAESGGAIGGWKYSEPTLIDCVFAHNRATGSHGGAIYFDLDGVLVVEGCIFYDNTAPTGAAIQCGFGHADAFISSCTFWGNKATDPAGSIINLAEAATLEMDHSIIALNVSGQAISVTDVDYVPTLACNDIYGNPGGDWVGCIADLLGVDGNISADPLFCEVESLIIPLTIAAESPCAPQNNPECGLVGARPVGCTIVGVGDPMPTVAGDRLYEVVPNPFNPRTSIEFSVERSQHVILTVHSVTGALVRTLANRTYDQGDHVLIWDGSNAAGLAMPSGVYLIRLETEDAFQTRKAMLVR